MKKKFKVLVVDDNHEWADSISSAFPETCVISSSYTVNDAINNISSQQYDILICDIKMPYVEDGMKRPDGGFVVCLEAKKKQIQCEIIVLTAYDSLQFEKDSLKESYTYIVKSFSIDNDITLLQEELTKIINNWLNTPPAPNPFNVQLGSTPNKPIFDRISYPHKDTALIGRLIEAKRCNPRMLICGMPGSGKTTTLNTCRSHLKKLGWLTFSLTISNKYGENNTSEQVATFFHDLFYDLPSDDDKLVKSILSSIKSLKAEISAYGTKVGLGFEKNPNNTDNSTEKTALQNMYNIFEKLSSNWHGFAIEIDDLNNAPVTANFIQLLWRIISSDKFDKFSFIIIASYTISLDEFKNGLLYPEISRFFAGEIYYLHNFTYFQFKGFVINSLCNTSVVFEDELIRDIFLLTSGHPYLSVLLCHYLYDSQVLGRVDSNQISAAIVSAKNELADFYNLNYKFPSLLKKYISLLPYDFACSDKKMLQKLLIDSDVQPENINTAIEALVEHSIIILNEDKYQFKDRLYAKYLKEITMKQ